VLTNPRYPDQLCLVAGGQGTLAGDDVGDVVITCDAPVVIDEFSASPGAVSSGEIVTLAWSTREASSCELSPGAISATPADFGTVDVSVDATTTFTLTCQGFGGPAVASVTVGVADNDWAALSTGTSHTCGVKSDGRLFCWGSGFFGKLGNGSTQDRPVPVQESTGATDWERVAAGGGHSCAIKTDGRLFCWGANTSGQLGTPVRSRPTDVSSAGVRATSASSVTARRARARCRCRKTRMPSTGSG
jgi:hypothetical protein